MTGPLLLASVVLVISVELDSGESSGIRGWFSRRGSGCFSGFGERYSHRDGGNELGAGGGVQPPAML